MVGPLRAQQAENDHSQVKVKILGKDSQIKDLESQVYEASKRDRLGKRQHTLDRCDTAQN